jgi:phage repressor protein C with HTH and peptisase S24 domain
VRSTRKLSVRASRKYKNKPGTFHFVAEITGRSMEPAIPDGSLCVFRRPPNPMPGSRVLVRRQLPEDPERGGRFVVKEYQPGLDGQPAKLVSLNPDYPPFAAGEDDTIVADWLENVEREP